MVMQFCHRPLSDALMLFLHFRSHSPQGRTLTTAWVGDSRGVLGCETPELGLHPVDLTEDHKPTNPEEKARILKTNGRVERCVHS